MRFWVNNGVKFCQFGEMFGVSFHIMRTSAIAGPKNVPACVRGYANRRPGSLYTFYFKFRPIPYDFGSTMVSSFVNLVIRLVSVLCKFSHCVHKCYCWAKVCARMRLGLCQ